MNAILKFYTLAADVDYIYRSIIEAMKHSNNPECIGVARGAQGARPPTEMPPMIKM